MENIIFRQTFENWKVGKNRKRLSKSQKVCQKSKKNKKNKKSWSTNQNVCQKSRKIGKTTKKVGQNVKKFVANGYKFVASLGPWEQAFWKKNGTNFFSKEKNKNRENHN